MEWTPASFGIELDKHWPTFPRGITKKRSFHHSATHLCFLLLSAYSRTGTTRPHFEGSRRTSHQISLSGESLANFHFFFLFCISSSLYFLRTFFLGWHGKAVDLSRRAQYRANGESLHLVRHRVSGESLHLIVPHWSLQMWLKQI